MLTAVPRHWHSWGFSLTEGGKSVADIDISSWREKGQLTISNVPYRVYRRSPFRGTFILESKGTVIARARKSNFFSRRMTIEYGKVKYELKPASIFSRRFHLISGKAVVGRLSPNRWFSRRMNIHLSENLPLPVSTFVVWLTLLMWKRDCNAGG